MLVIPCLGLNLEKSDRLHCSGRVQLIIASLRRPLEHSPLAPRNDTNNSDYCLTITASGPLLLFKQPPLSVNSATQSDTAVEMCLKYVLTTLVCVDVSLFTRLTNSFIGLYSVQL